MTREEQAGRRAFARRRDVSANPYPDALRRAAWTLGYELAEADDIALAEGWPLGDTPVRGH